MITARTNTAWDRPVSRSMLLQTTSQRTELRDRRRARHFTCGPARRHSPCPALSQMQAAPAGHPRAARGAGVRCHVRRLLRKIGAKQIALLAGERGRSSFSHAGGSGFSVHHGSSSDRDPRPATVARCPARMGVRGPLRLLAPVPPPSATWAIDQFNLTDSIVVATTDCCAASRRASRISVIIW